MGKAKLSQEAKSISFTDTDTCGGPFADTIDGQDRSLLKGTGIKRARGVRFVMTGPNDAMASFATESFLDGASHEELFAQPRGHGLREGSKAHWRESEVGLEQSLELEQRFFIEGDVIDLIGFEASGIEAIANGVGRETRIMFDSREPLLLGCRNDLAVHQQSGGGVMVEGGDAQDAGHGFAFGSPGSRRQGPAESGSVLKDLTITLLRVGYQTAEESLRVVRPFPGSGDVDFRDCLEDRGEIEATVDW